MNTVNDRNDRFERTVCTFYFSWTPVLIGALVGVGLGLLLDLFAMGIGLSSYTTDPNGATILAVGGFLGSVVGAFFSMFTAGFAAGFFAGPLCGNRNYGFVYGFVAWSLALVLMIFLSTSFANFTASRTHTQMTAPTAAEVAQTSRRVTERLHPATDAGDTTGEKNVRAIGIMSFSFFLILMVGALSAAFGGYFGMEYWNKWYENERLNKRL